MDEVFDPSALIDIEKFRAVNAPTKQVGDCYKNVFILVAFLKNSRN